VSTKKQPAKKQPAKKKAAPKPRTRRRPASARKATAASAIEKPKPARKAPAKKRAPVKKSPAKQGEPSSGALVGAVAAGAGAVAGGSAKALGRGLLALCRSRDVQRLVAIGVLAGALLGTSKLVKERVQTWDQFELRLGLRADAPPPPGLSPAATRDLAAIVLPDHVHAFHPGVVPGLAKHLDSLPWVASVEQLRLLPPAKLELKLRTHRPLAQLGESNGDLVASGGALIPRVYGAHPDRLPRLLGVSGGLDQAQHLQVGVQVLQALGPLVAQVEAVDLSNLNGRRDPLRSEVVLRLAGGLLVDWGRPEPIEVEGLENLGPPRRDPAAKRADLEAFLAGFPQVSSVERVSLRFDEVTYTLRTSTPGEPISRR
jgi:hypothetical protein